MANYRNLLLLKKIGKRLNDQRLKKKLEIKDVSERTGFSVDTIKNIESGNETTISYLVEICKSIGVHPKEIFDFPIKLKPRNEATAARLEKSRLTNRIKDYFKENYFSQYRGTSEVKIRLQSEFEIKTSSAAVSVILSRLVKSNFLKYKKVNGKKLYINKE